MDLDLVDSLSRDSAMGVKISAIRPQGEATPESESGFATLGDNSVAFAHSRTGACKCDERPSQAAEASGQAVESRASTQAWPSPAECCYDAPNANDTSIWLSVRFSRQLSPANWLQAQLCQLLSDSCECKFLGPQKGIWHAQRVTSASLGM